MPQASADRDQTSRAGPLTTVLGPVRTAAGRSPAAAKARVRGSDDRNSGSPNPSADQPPATPGSTNRTGQDARRGPWMTSMLASSSRLMVPRPAASWVDGTHTSGSKSPKTIASSGVGNLSGRAVS